MNFLRLYLHEGTYLSLRRDKLFVGIVITFEVGILVFLLLVIISYLYLSCFAGHWHSLYYIYVSLYYVHESF